MAGIEFSTSLTSFELVGAAISDDAIERIGRLINEAAKNMAKLTMLDVRNTGITPAGVAKLQAGLSLYHVQHTK